jgi:superfamily II DNA/RNA helicase
MEGIFERFGEIPTDTKAEALRRLSSERAKQGRGIAHTCVWTGFAATAQYLTRVLEGGPVFRLAAAMELDVRVDIVARFRADGGVLLTNGPAIEELSLPFVDTCIHYDLPVDPRSLEQRLGVFLRYGRTKPFESIALRDLAHSLAWEEDVFQKLEAIVHATPSQGGGTRESQ